MITQREREKTVTVLLDLTIYLCVLLSMHKSSETVINCNHGLTASIFLLRQMYVKMNNVK